MQKSYDCTDPLIELNLDWVASTISSLADEIESVKGTLNPSSEEPDASLIGLGKTRPS